MHFSETVKIKLDAVKDSRQGYNSLLLLFGGLENIPSSVMRAKIEKPTYDRDLEGTKRSYKETAPHQKRRKEMGYNLPKELDTVLSVSGRGCQQVGALSIFPQKIGRSVVLFYSNPGDIIVDPFAGHNSRMDLCVKAGRHYIGCDLSTEFHAFNVKRAEKLREIYPDVEIELHHCDSRKMPVKDEIGDFTLTSPPYWDIEYYGDEAEQLGKSQTYKEFLDGISKVLKCNFRALKSEAFACWFINDFRKKGKFYSYHSDIIRLGKKAGFNHHDTMIVDFGRSFRKCFPNQAFQTKILAKQHEYCIVFRKPTEG
jgi:DNA methylase